MMDASEALQYMAAVLNELQADNARLREAGNKMSWFISTWHNSLAGVQMTDEDFDTSCGLVEWMKARAALGKEG